MSLIKELRRRNVIRMAGLYLVGAWIVVQVAETLLPIFGTPAWVLKTLVALLALGFVPALVFSWLYELTPGGLKRDAEVTPEQSISAQTGRRMDRLIVVGLVAVVALVAADRFWPGARTVPGAVPGASSGAAADAERMQFENLAREIGVRVGIGVLRILAGPLIAHGDAAATGFTGGRPPRNGVPRIPRNAAARRGNRYPAGG